MSENTEGLNERLKKQEDIINNLRSEIEGLKQELSSQRANFFTTPRTPQPSCSTGVTLPPACVYYRDDTEDDDTKPENLRLPVATNGIVPLLSNSYTPSMFPAAVPHPLLLPPNTPLKPFLPKPVVNVQITVDEILILNWDMPYNLDLYERILGYEIFAYEKNNLPPTPDMWKRVGYVQALPLPMSCMLTQFKEITKYYFIIRSVDQLVRNGHFSDPVSC